MKRFRKNSLYSSLLIGLLTFLLPVNIILFCYTLYSGYAFTAHANDTYTDYANLVCKQIDHQLSELHTYLSNLYYVDDRLAQIGRTADLNERYLIAQEINFSANDYLQLHTVPILFFIHCDGLSIPAVSTFTSNPDSVAMSDYIHSLDENMDYPAGSFFLLQLNEHYYLAEYFKRNDVCLGALIDLASLLDTLDYNDSDITAAFFSGPDDSVLTDIAAEVSSSSLLIRSPLSYVPAFLTLEISRVHILGRLFSLMILTVLMFLVSVVCIAAYILFIRRKIQQPLERLKKTITCIQSGTLENKVQDQNIAVEISEVYDTFNHFMDNITSLKMTAYEEKLSRQQTEMQYLRLQLRPHFFLNSLKGIYALAQRHETAKIQDYVLCLSAHYRFLLYDTTNLISLKDELQHTQNYIQLQRIGYNLTIDCDVHIRFPIDALQVPSLIIQTFVENSVKYASMPGRPLQLTISIGLASSDSLVDFTIQDNGPGFPSEILDELNHQEEAFFQKHKGVGNLKRRLKIMYAGESYIYLYNHPGGGAVAEILLPYKTYQENAKEEML